MECLIRYEDRRKLGSTDRMGHLNYDEPDNFILGYAPKDKATFAIYFNKDKWSVVFDGFYFIRDTSYIDPKKVKG